MSEKKVCEVKNVHFKVVERVSSKGKKYNAIVVCINGVDVSIGFSNVYTENALLRAGVKFEKV